MTASVGLEPADPALDVEEPLGAHVGAEAGLGDERSRCARMAMRSAMTDDVPVAMLPNGPAVDEGRPALERLQQVGLEGVLEDHRHRPGGARSSAVTALPVVV